MLYLYQLIYGLEYKDRWVVISMLVLCNATVITEYDRRRLDFPNARLSGIWQQHDRGISP